MGMGQVGGGGIPAGHCRWTKEGGVWKVESNCGSGNRCMLINKVEGGLEDLGNGQGVSLTAQGTLSGEFGLVNATFTELLASRSIPTTSIVSNMVGDGEITSAASASNGSFIDIPCIPANSQAIDFNSSRPHYALPA